MFKILCTLFKYYANALLLDSTDILIFFYLENFRCIYLEYSIRLLSLRTISTIARSKKNFNILFSPIWWGTRRCNKIFYYLLGFIQAEISGMEKRKEHVSRRRQKKRRKLIHHAHNHHFMLQVEIFIHDLK